MCQNLVVRELIYRDNKIEIVDKLHSKYVGNATKRTDSRPTRRMSLHPFLCYKILQVASPVKKPVLFEKLMSVMGYIIYFYQKTYYFSTS